MGGNRKVNSDLDILGKIKISTVPNNTGTVLTYNSSTKEISTRSNAEVASDLGLVTTSGLNTTLSDYSVKSANETLAGIKSFTYSPIVPTPTLNTHAVNKIYVDGNFIPNSQKNQPNGVATLGSDGKHTPTQYGVQATHEAYQNWGGQHVVGASPIDAALNNRINANRFAFFPANKMVIESSTDGGVTWTDQGVSDATKISLCNDTGANIPLKQGIVVGENYTNYRSRITFKFKDSGLYDSIKKLQLYISTRGSKYIGQDAAFVNVYTRTQEDVTAGNDVWTKIIDQQKIAGWSGWNTLNVNVTTTTGTTYVGELRFEFGQTDYMPQYIGLQIISIRAIGTGGYNSPSNLARTGHIYDYDSLQNAVFPAGVRATKFWTNTGTSNDILLANGTTVTKTLLLAAYTSTSDLNTQLNNYVTKNGAVTINGTKTFTESPIVPTPTLNSHAVNKGYIDTELAKKSEKDTNEEWYGKKYLSNTFPLVFNDPTENTNRFGFHKPNNISSVILVPSTEPDSDNWIWANQIEFKENGKIKNNGYEIAGYDDNYVNTAGGSQAHKRDLLWTKKNTYDADGSTTVIAPKGLLTTIHISGNTDTSTRFVLPRSATNGQRVLFINDSSATWVEVYNSTETLGTKAYNSENLEFTFVRESDGEGVLSGNGNWHAFSPTDGKIKL